MSEQTEIPRSASTGPYHVRVDDAPECNVCEIRHPYGTEHPERIHPGARTVKVRMAVAIFPGGLVRTVAHNLNSRLSDTEILRIACSLEYGIPPDVTRFAEVEIPIESAETIRGEVVK